MNIPLKHFIPGNGEIASAVSLKDGLNANLRVVLHRSHRQDEWVTHVENLDCGGYHGGCYFDTWESAFENYLERCKIMNVRPIA